MSTESAAELFRHTLATLAYRGAKALRGAPDSFSEFRPAADGRTSGQILAHICDVLDWGLTMAKDKHVWIEQPPQRWGQDVERFFAAIRAFDDFIASGAPLQAPLDKLFQGPVADALTHIGQIAMLRRLAESPVRAENFFKAPISFGAIE